MLNLKVAPPLLLQGGECVFLKKGRDSTQHSSIPTLLWKIVEKLLERSSMVYEFVPKLCLNFSLFCHLVPIQWKHSDLVFWDTLSVLSWMEPSLSHPPTPSNFKAAISLSPLGLESEAFCLFCFRATVFVTAPSLLFRRSNLKSLCCFVSEISLFRFFNEIFSFCCWGCRFYADFRGV